MAPAKFQAAVMSKAPARMEKFLLTTVTGSVIKIEFPLV